MDEALRAELRGMARAAGPVGPSPDAVILAVDPVAARSLHARNADRLAEIVAAHGWPGRSLAGEDGAEAAWTVAMHATARPALMRAWATEVERAAHGGEAPRHHVAHLMDRIRVLAGKEQVYATQFDWDDDGLLSPLPITRVDTVDVRRDAVGLAPLAEATDALRARVRQRGPNLATRRAILLAFCREIGWR